MFGYRGILIVLLLWSTPFTTSFDASLFRRSCFIGDEPVVQVAVDPITGTVVLVSDVQAAAENQTKGEPSPTTRERLLGAAGYPARRALETSNAPTTNESTFYPDITGWQREFARECVCGNWGFRASNVSLWYCPDYVLYCQVSAPSRANDLWTPHCANDPKDVKFARSIWPATVSFVGIFFVCLFFTTRGQSVCDLFLTLTCYPDRTERVADRILRNDPDRATHMIAAYRWRRRREIIRTWTPEERRAYQAAMRRREEREALENFANILPRDESDTEEPTPNKLLLKTTCYRRPESDSAEDQQEQHTNDLVNDTCTICFAPIQDGERVGVLKCKHIFHVGCLKTWLIRRNVCPLCQTENIATPQYDDDDTHSQSSSLSISPSSAMQETGGGEANSDNADTTPDLSDRLV